jgi:hypothetical protein
MDGTAAEGSKVGKPPWNPPPCPAQLGQTTVRLPLGGLASTDAERIRRPLVRPFWLLAMALGFAVLAFVWLRLTLSCRGYLAGRSSANQNALCGNGSANRMKNPGQPESLIGELCCRPIKCESTSNGRSRTL